MNFLRGRTPFLTLLIVALTAGTLSLPTPVSAAATDLTYFRNLEPIRKVMELIKSDYVEENIDEQKLIYGAINGMLGALEDPYTRFMEPKNYKEMQVETQGEFGGLGIVITVKNKALTVISPMEDTPAKRAGVRAGDVIIKIDGKDTTDMALNDAVKLLRGPEGSKVTIVVVREDDKDTHEFTMTREVIKVPSIKYWVIKPNIGYIRLTQFIQTSSEDLEKALLALEKAKVNAVILDLRNNPGGLLTAAVEVSRKFLPKGDIVSIKSRDGEKNTYQSFYASHPLLPLVVLINEGSASASEIVAGALRDNKRAVLVGQKSFGKGSVQTVIGLNDGSALALTTALYYTPCGESIHKKGITPDIVVELPKLNDEQRKEIAKAYEEEEKQRAKIEKATDTAVIASLTAALKPTGFIEPPDSLTKGAIQDYVQNPYDSQLQRAVDVLKSMQIVGPILKQMPDLPAAPPAEKGSGTASDSSKGG